MQDTLPQEREARASIALALEQLQAGDLPFHAVAVNWSRTDASSTEVNPKIEFVINLQPAKALGLTLAPEVLYQANRLLR